MIAEHKRMSAGELRRAHQEDLHLLSVVYHCRQEVARIRLELARAEEQLGEAEDNYQRVHEAVEAEAVPCVVELRTARAG